MNYMQVGRSQHPQSCPFRLQWPIAIFFWKPKKVYHFSFLESLYVIIDYSHWPMYSWIEMIYGYIDVTLHQGCNYNNYWSYILVYVYITVSLMMYISLIEMFTLFSLRMTTSICIPAQISPRTKVVLKWEPAVNLTQCTVYSFNV